MSLEPSSETPIVVAQVLHGYLDGHRLLASSMHLPAEAQNAMLFVSDLSGSSRVRGFDAYLTGYPVPVVSSYALARTWYAEEMRRPGCVWTHTLLVAFSDLARIRDFRALIQLFRRPNGEHDAVLYERDLSFQPSTFPDLAYRREHSDAEADETRCLVYSLYAKPADRIVVPSDTSTALEESVLLLWTQQWPRLRRSFAFCTGSLGARSLPGLRFDLEIVPAIKAFSFQDRQTTIIDWMRKIDAMAYETTNLAPSGNHELWLDLLVKDLLHGVPELRSFCWAFGADVHGGRESVRPLASVFIALWRMMHRQVPIEDLLLIVGEAFPKPTDAQQLKIALFGLPQTRQRFNLVTAGEGEILAMLGTSKWTNAIDVKTLNLQERAQTLAHGEPENAASLFLRLFDSATTEVGKQLAESLIEHLGRDQLVPILLARPRLLSSLVTRDPEILLDAALWIGSPAALQQELTDLAVARADLEPSAQRALVRVMLQAGILDLPYHIVRRLGGAGAMGVLDWLQAGSVTESNAELGDGWSDLLQVHAREVLLWLEKTSAPSPAILAILPRVLEPRDLRAYSSAEGWLKVIKLSRKKHKVSKDAIVELDALAFSFAIGDPSPKAGDLLSEVFPPLHDALAHEIVPRRARRILDEHLPHLGLFQNWDWCERLRRAYADAFVANEFAPGLFLSRVPDPRVRARLTDYLCTWKKGKQFCRQVSNAI